MPITYWKVVTLPGEAEEIRTDQYSVIREPQN
jgi:hypothetical protein